MKHSNPWLAIDVSNLAHRALHTTGSLSYRGDATGVLFGVFRDVASLTELFATDRVAFCFDGGCDKRWELFPAYKESRKKRRREMDENELEVRRELRRQIYRLRTRLLGEAGFENVFWQEGYEADDVIAWLCDTYRNEEFVIVSSDQDLWQCLVKGRIICWNPVTKKSVTQQSFESEFGVSPSMWAMVKAIAGCSGDGVPGVRGVGEKTAAKFLSGTLKSGSKAWKSIVGSNELVERNLGLVRLPMKGCGPFGLVDNEVEASSWDRVVEALGMRSLVGKRR